MVERISALSGSYKQGNYGKEGEPGVVLSELPGLVLCQVSAWPDTLNLLGLNLAESIGVDKAPAPGCVVVGAQGTLLRVEPLKWWCYGCAVLPSFSPYVGTKIDLSHSRTHVRIGGREAQNCLNRLVPIDLRLESCPIGSVMSSSFHHVTITIWRSASGYELFIPRGFSLSLWEVLIQTAGQFGVKIS
jgi:heterotetrameric sarcosine oxidase gamma subunit